MFNIIGQFIDRHVPEILITWIFLVTFYHCMVLFIYVQFYTKNEQVHFNKYLPKWIKIYLINLYNSSKTVGNQGYLIFYNRTMFIHIILSIVSLILYYIFNKVEMEKIQAISDQLLDFSNFSYKTSSLWGFDNISQIISSYQTFLDNLTLDQKYAVIHILLSIIIFLSLFNIIGLYLGDELIKFLKLEEKYPKIAKYIRLRRRFITYNIIFDSLIILLALIVIVGFNLYNILY